MVLCCVEHDIAETRTVDPKLRREHPLMVNCGLRVPMTDIQLDAFQMRKVEQGPVDLMALGLFNSAHVM